MDSLEQLHLPSSGTRYLNSSPSLYIVATPLGNLYDITLRALGVLGKVDAIAAEDTRHTRGLLEHYGISTRLMAVHQHNEQAAADGLVALLEQGQHIALVTDAGTPAVSDPGAKVVARVQAAGFPVVPVPGPSAVITALSASGCTDDRFMFVGFLPSRPAARRAELERLAAVASALVFYEAPHRISECVADMAELLGAGRELTVARELTKLYEEIARIPLAEAAAWFAADPNRVRGEFVLIVSAPPQEVDIPLAARRLLELLLEELPVSRAARIAAEATGVAKKKLYELGLELKPEA
ncbi:16S rRNA (cytidine(1402)-2'-O)-methyltransferase [Niveibacterium terrae]|uniref:16S rRNA (cytidine(1402)-2'-O)-methyltransferase n=1 Tax=Niveibacterium terrae TaxID=3373598 RepID=UPI003A8D402B